MLAPHARMRHRLSGAMPLLVFQQPFQDAYRRVERGARARRRLAVPAAILELLAEQALEQPVDFSAEIGARPQYPPVDAGLGFAVEERTAVELPPPDAVLHEADRLAHLFVGRIRAQILQQGERVVGGHPAVLAVVTPIAVFRLQAEQLGAPTL